MESRNGHAGRVCLTVLGTGLVLVATTPGQAQSVDSGASIPAPATNVRIHNAAQAARAVGRALEGASHRLESPSCRQLLTDFNDLSGRPLQASLDELGLAPQQYLDIVMFYEGSRKLCRNGATAMTAPGNRVVYICASRFQSLQKRKPVEAEAVIIHEMLHTLGLGENPPSPREINFRVAERCAF